MMTEPFSGERLNEIFRVSPRNPEYVVSRESTTLEFKESFGLKSLSDYSKTAAAFANRKGGYIVFGVTNAPHKLVGLMEPAFTLFKTFESAKFTNHLNEYFCPSINWAHHLFELDNRYYGIFYFYESEEKPVVCLKNGDETKESDILYRYRAQSQRIKYPELRSIIDDARKKEQQLWMEQILRVARIGIQNTGIFDLTTGQVTGRKGSFLIEESLLKKLVFIKEGEFSEREGKPTLKLIGNVTPVSAIALKTKQVIKEPKIINLEDIILCFLRQEKIPDPEDYIKQICYGNISYLPVYYYIKKTGLGIENALSIIEAVKNRSQAKNKLIKRLQNGSTHFMSLSGINSLSSIQRRKYKKDILSGKVTTDLENRELIYYLQAIRGFRQAEVIKHKKILFNLLEGLFNKHYQDKMPQIAGEIRSAICWVDEALYMTNNNKKYGGSHDDAGTAARK